MSPTCDMEKGHLRCDANVSVRLKGAEKFGTKAEVKNLNSFRFLKMALDYEIARQVAIIEGGGRIEQETRQYNSSTGETVGMRSKEHAHDYRYFPEPDLVPLRISEKWLADVKAQMPELPALKRERFVEKYGLREYDAQVLTATRSISDYFEKAAAVSGDARMAANWVMGELAGALKAENQDIADSRVSAEKLGELVALIGKGDLSGKLAKEVFEKMWTTGDSAPAIMEREGLAPDQRHRRARKNRGRRAGGQSQTSGTISRRQNSRDGFSGGPGHESVARPSQSRPRSMKF